MIYIIGNGLFGRVANDLLYREGIESTIIDAEKPNSGTMASGNLMKPSWLTGINKERDKAYEDLDALYGIETFKADIAFGKTIDLNYVARYKVVNGIHMKARVTDIGDGWAKLDNGGIIEGKILVAAGVWSDKLVKIPQIDCIVGVSFLFQQFNWQAKFKVWAPFKQAISYQSGHNSVWFGDGTAIKLKNFTDQRIKDSLLRAETQGLIKPVETFTGYRPIIKGMKHGYFAKVYPNTWVSTGGGKNGIVLAAIQARRFLEEVS